MAYKVFAALSANGSTSSVPYTEGSGAAMIYGTWGGGTLVMEVSHDGTNWAALDGMSFTADAAKGFNIPRGTRVRFTLTGATAPTINAVLM